MKVGILTYHRARNYGAFLQSVSLCSRLNQEPDIDAEIIDFDTSRAEIAYSIKLLSLKSIYHPKKTLFDLKMKKAFERGYEKTKHLRSKETMVSDDISDFQRFVNNKYDVIIVGSDEVWNTMYKRGFAKPYFLIGVTGCRKFSYAASARCDYNKMNDKDHESIRNGLREFEYISVRDLPTYNQMIAEGINQSNLTISCDPSYLYDFDVKKKNICEIIKNKKIDEKKKNMLVLCENKVVCKSIHDELGHDYNLITAAIPVNGFISEPDLDPFEWMELIKSVDFVISSFYHGVCYSIINNTPFIAVASSASRRSKLLDMLNETPLEDRFVDVGNENVSWHNYVERFSKNSNFSEFVNTKRESFSGYLERLKNQL